MQLYLSHLPQQNMRPAGGPRGPARVAASVPEIPWLARQLEKHEGASC